MNGRHRVAWNLRRIRTSRGITQEALAVDANVDRSYISGIEQESFNATVDVLDKLAGALGCDLSELTTPIDPTAEPPAGLTPGRKGKRS